MVVVVKVMILSGGGRCGGSGDGRRVCCFVIVLSGSCGSSGCDGGRIKVVGIDVLMLR